MADLIPTREAMARAYESAGDCGLYRALGWAYRGGVTQVDWEAVQNHEPADVPPLPIDFDDEIERLGAIIRNGGELTIKARA